MPVHITKVVGESKDIMDYKYKQKLTEAKRVVKDVNQLVEQKTKARDSKDVQIQI